MYKHISGTSSIYFIMSNLTIKNVIIRKAERQDMRQVYHLIKELAEFEHLKHQMKISLSTLEDDGFGKKSPLFNCMVAELSDGQIVGYAIYYTAYSTWLGEFIFLEDIYVKVGHRKNGIGQKLFLTVAKIAYATASKRLDFHVLSWNPATDFYHKFGAINLTSTEEWQLYRLNERNLKKLFDADIEDGK